MDFEGIDEATLIDLFENMTPEGHLQQASTLLAASMRQTEPLPHEASKSLLMHGQLHATMAVAKQLASD